MPGEDIFNRQDNQFGGAFSAEQAKLTLVGGLATVAQQLQLTYAQQITRVWELGSNALYYVAGRTQGNATVQRIVGPQETIAAVYEDYGNVCNPQPLDVNFEPGGGDNCPEHNGNYTLEDAVITQVGFSVQAQDMLINENMQFMYSNLGIEGLGT